PSAQPPLVGATAPAGTTRLVLIPSGNGGSGCRTAGAQFSQNCGFRASGSYGSANPFDLANGRQFVIRDQTPGLACTGAADGIPRRSRKLLCDQSTLGEAGKPLTIMGAGTWGAVGAIPVGKGKAPSPAISGEVAAASARIVANRFMSPPPCGSSPGVFGRREAVGREEAVLRGARDERPGLSLAPGRGSGINGTNGIHCFGDVSGSASVWIFGGTGILACASFLHRQECLCHQTDCTTPSRLGLRILAQSAISVRLFGMLRGGWHDAVRGSLGVGLGSWRSGARPRGHGRETVCR